MGQQADCTARFRGKISRGRALLESEELIFRGAFRLAIPFRAMKSVSARDGVLRVRTPEGAASFALGAPAAGWAERILHPKSLLDKLGVNPGAAVSVRGVRDAGFLRQLGERSREIAGPETRKESDLIFLGAERASDLRTLRALVPTLKKTGAVWVVYPKGQAAFPQAEVMAAGKKAGLVDVKVVSFSPTHTALKFVIPVSRR